MHIINKIRWRLEKYILDPIINSYLKKRIYQKNDCENFYTTKDGLNRIYIRKIFQSMLTNSDMEMLYQKDFDNAYSRGIKNDPINIQQKELLRYRVYVNTVISQLAVNGGGDFCTVGVSWGIVPRTIYQYLYNSDFWNSDRKYFLVDKWEKILFASEKNIVQENYCGDIEFVKNEFKEKTFKIIQEYAPKAFEGIKNKISYLHLNTGDKAAEFETIKLLYERLTNPGFIIIDNYHFSDQEDSIDGYLKKKNNFVLSLGNSQGIVIKL